MKHGNREFTIYPKPSGNTMQVNAQGQKLLEEILYHPNKKILIDEKLRYGKYFDVTVNELGGARFNMSGDFIGFLEP